MARITDSEISEIFTEEVASATTPSDVEIYGIAHGNIYVRRFHNPEGFPVPPMTAYLVAIFDDGTREETVTNDPDEITAWCNLMRG